MKPIILAVWSDKHTNSTVGLCPPSFRQDDQWSSVISKYQQWVWDCWLDYIGQIKQAAKGCTVIGVENGDSVDVDHKKRSSQSITQNHVIAVNMAHEVDKPLLRLCDKFYLTRGTEAHEGSSSEYAVMLAEKAGAEIYDGTQAPQVLLLNLCNVLIEITHHAIGGYRKAPMSARAAAQLAEDTIIDYSDSGDRIPDLVLRGHVHRFADSGDAFRRCRAITSGAWRLGDAHSHRAGYGTQRFDIGGLIIKIDNGRYEVTKCRYTPARARPAIYRE